MEWHYLVYSTLIILLPALIFIKFRPRPIRLPPGPNGWPIFGHVFSLGPAPHRTIAALQPQYGDVVWLKLGSVNTVAALTAKAAAELFKNHDLSFADRSIVDTMTAKGYHHGSLALAPYGARWRMLRRLCSVEMFAWKRIQETASIRRKCVEDMLAWIEKDGGKGSILLGKYVFLAAFNMLGNLMMSRDLVDPESENGTEFYGAMKRVMEWSGTPNVSDLFPWIRRFDLQGLKRRADRDMEVAFGIASGFVNERIRDHDYSEEHNDFLDMLLKIQSREGELSETDITIFILEMFLAGTETSSNTIEWAMTELLRSPKTMSKAKAELSGLINPLENFQETHIDNLPYLQAVIKETLRLHPPIPFLIPRRAVRDTNFMGYLVPKNTQLLVNVWAIGRDQECWEDAGSFKPERFLGLGVDYRGQNFELIPFGAGRRICAGLTLGHKMLHFVLGSLLREFEWEPDSSVAGPDAFDMNERIGITVGKLQPLKVNVKKISHL